MADQPHAFSNLEESSTAFQYRGYKTLSRKTVYNPRFSWGKSKGRCYIQAKRTRFCFLLMVVLNVWQQELFRSISKLGTFFMFARTLQTMEATFCIFECILHCQRIENTCRQSLFVWKRCAQWMQSFCSCMVCFVNISKKENHFLWYFLLY